jgi:hypothetical protein
MIESLIRRRRADGAGRRPRTSFFAVPASPRSGSWDAEDYNVFDGEQNVERICQVDSRTDQEKRNQRSGLERVPDETARRSSRMPG